MKNTFKLFSGIWLSLFIAGCNEEPVLTVLDDVAFPGSHTMSTGSIILEEADSADVVLTLNWPAVEYPITAPVIYSVEITTVENASTWSEAHEIVAGNDQLSLSITGKQLNSIADELGLEPGVASDLLCRVKSFVDRPAYTDGLAFNLTSYEVFAGYPSLWVPGAYEGWDPSTAPVIVSAESNDIYEGFLYLPTGEIKLTAQPAWEPMAYGDGGSGTLIEANYAGGNFNITEEGYYLIAADLNTMQYLLVKTTWGIIGGATPGGWESDTPMTYDQETGKWSVTCDMLASGSFKFRANGAWQYDFGLDEEGNPEYCNHPWKTYVDRPQFTVPSDGNYTITLDLSEPGDYSFSITKN